MTATFFRRGRGRSRNAAIAEHCDRMPLTRAAQAVATEAHVTIALAKRALIATWDGEWHHVGKFAAETNYYDVMLALDWLSKCVSVESLEIEARKYEAGQARAKKAAATRDAKKAAVKAEAERRYKERVAEYTQGILAERRVRAERKAAHNRALVARFLAEPTFNRAAELTRQGFDPSALIG